MQAKGQAAAVRLSGRRAKTGFACDYKVYATRYQASERTVKRWVKLGRSAGDSCPLDAPAGMPAWWARVMSTAVPDSIMAAAAAGSAEVVPRVPDTREEPTGHVLPRELLPVGDDEVGLQSSLRRLRETEVQSHRIMIEALKANDEGKAKLAQKMWTEIVTQVRQMERAAREDAAAVGQLVPKGEAERILVEMHSGIERAMRGMYRRFCELTGVRESPETESKWNEECDGMFEAFGKEVFHAGNV